MVLIAYAAVKMVQLIQKQNPNISQFSDTNYFDFEERVSLQDIDFRFAFSLEGYFDQEMKNSTAYVKYFVRMIGKKDGVDYETAIPFHRCTDEDWEQFPKPAAASEGSINQIRANPNRGMMCLDWSNGDEDYFVYGREVDIQYQRIDVVMTPCNFIYTLNGIKDDTVSDDCVPDLEKQVEYLGPLNWLVYFTEEVLQQD